jgi:hypothetical protein
MGFMSIKKLNKPAITQIGANRPQKGRENG